MSDDSKAKVRIGDAFRGVWGGYFRTGTIIDIRGDKALVDFGRDRLVNEIPLDYLRPQDGFHRTWRT